MTTSHLLTLMKIASYLSILLNSEAIYLEIIDFFGFYKKIFLLPLDAQWQSDGNFRSVTIQLHWLAAVTVFPVLILQRALWLVETARMTAPPPDRGQWNMASLRCFLRSGKVFVWKYNILAT